MTLAFFGSIGAGELIVIIIIAIMLFGSKLPEVGKTVGKTLFQLRKGLDEIKGDLYSTTGDIREEVQKTQRELNRALTEPLPEAKVAPAEPPVKSSNLADAKPAADESKAAAPPGKEDNTQPPEDSSI